jgi:LysM repeat protein
MTIVDGDFDAAKGEIVMGVSGGVKITYDSLGRRQTSETFNAHYEPPDSQAQFIAKPGSGDPNTFFKYDSYVVDHYTYDDLGYLVDTDQSINRRNMLEAVGTGNYRAQQDEIGTTLEEKEFRVTNRSGRVDQVFEFTGAKDNGPREFADDSGGNLISWTTSVFRNVDGQISGGTNQQFDAVSGNRTGGNSTTYLRDDAGNVTVYIVRNRNADLQVTDSTIYRYEYDMQVDGLKAMSITGTNDHGASHTGNLVNRYDNHGNLFNQTIDDQDNIVFNYDLEGHVVTKTDFNKAFPNTGLQQYYYAQGHEVAVLGSGPLAIAQIVSGFTPISPQYPSSAPGQYTVQAGDTLSSIAKTLWGDGSLWYLIADANSLKLGPQQAVAPEDVGRSLIVPNVVTSVHSNSSTFAPYDAGKIIGNNLPPTFIDPPAPPCTGPAAVVASVFIEVVAAVVDAVVTGVLTYYLHVDPSTAGAIGGALSDLTSQGLGNLVGIRDGFSWSELATATAEGYATEGESGIEDAADRALLKAGGKVLMKEGGQALSDGLQGKGWHFDVESAVSDFTTDVVAETALGGHSWYNTGNVNLAESALNPHSGWLFSDHRDWTTIVSSTVNAYADSAIKSRVNADLKDTFEPASDAGDFNTPRPGAPLVAMGPQGPAQVYGLDPASGWFTNASDGATDRMPGYAADPYTVAGVVAEMGGSLDSGVYHGEPIEATPADGSAKDSPKVPFGGELRDFLNKSSDDSNPDPKQTVHINLPAGIFVQGNVPDQDNPAAVSVGITFGKPDPVSRPQTPDQPSTTDNTDMIPREGAPVSTGSPAPGVLPPAPASAPLGPVGYTGGESFFDRSAFVPPPPIISGSPVLGQRLDPATFAREFAAANNDINHKIVAEDPAHGRSVLVPLSSLAPQVQEDKQRHQSIIIPPSRAGIPIFGGAGGPPRSGTDDPLRPSWKELEDFEKYVRDNPPPPRPTPTPERAPAEPPRTTGDDFIDRSIEVLKRYGPGNPREVEAWNQPWPKFPSSEIPPAAPPLPIPTNISPDDPFYPSVVTLSRYPVKNPNAPYNQTPGGGAPGGGAPGGGAPGGGAPGGSKPDAITSASGIRNVPGGDQVRGSKPLEPPVINRSGYNLRDPRFAGVRAQIAREHGFAAEDQGDGIPKQPTPESEAITPPQGNRRRGGGGRGPAGGGVPPVDTAGASTPPAGVPTPIPTVSLPDGRVVELEIDPNDPELIEISGNKHFFGSRVDHDPVGRLINQRTNFPDGGRNACLAASCAMILESNGITNWDPEILSTGANTVTIRPAPEPSKIPGLPPLPKTVRAEGAPIQLARAILEVHGVAATPFQPNQTLADLAANTSPSKPGIAQVVDRDGLSHAVVIDGVEVHPNGSYTVKVRDPDGLPLLVEGSDFNRVWTGNKALYTNGLRPAGTPLPNDLIPTSTDTAGRAAPDALTESRAPIAEEPGVPRAPYGNPEFLGVPRNPLSPGSSGLGRSALSLGAGVGNTALGAYNIVGLVNGGAQVINDISNGDKGGLARDGLFIGGGLAVAKWVPGGGFLTVEAGAMYNAVVNGKEYFNNNQQAFAQITGDPNFGMRTPDKTSDEVWDEQEIIGGAAAGDAFIDTLKPSVSAVVDALRPSKETQSYLARLSSYLYWGH